MYLYICNVSKLQAEKESNNFEPLKSAQIKMSVALLSNEINLYYTMALKFPKKSRGFLLTGYHHSHRAQSKPSARATGLQGKEQRKANFPLPYLAQLVTTYYVPRPSCVTVKIALPLMLAGRLQRQTHFFQFLYSQIDLKNARNKQVDLAGQKIQMLLYFIYKVLSMGQASFSRLWIHFWQLFLI